MDQKNLISLLANLTGNLIPHSSQNEKEIELLQRELIHHLTTGTPGSYSNPLSFENIDDFSLEGIDQHTAQHIEAIVKEFAAEVKQQGPDIPLFKIFRREVPFVSSQINGSVPEWARGALIEKTIGPFISKNARRFWFDFFRIVKLFPVYVGAETTPSILVPLRIQILPLSKKIFTIHSGSIWIRSKLFVPSLAGNLYTGFSIKGGQLEFSQDTALGIDKITVPASIIISLQLDLAQPVVNDISPDQHGIDVKNAMLNLPEKCSMQLSGGVGIVTAATNSSWKLYGTQCNFVLDKTQAAYFEPALNRVMIPFRCDQSEFKIDDIQSPFLSLEGAGHIFRSAWALTTAAIDIINPPVAGGIGAMAIQCNKGISTSWTGLKDNNLHDAAFIQLSTPWFMMEPGRICLTDLSAKNNLAKQLYKLWTNKVNSPEEKIRRSTIELTFNKTFPLVYNAFQKGDESIFTITNTIASLDRPVKVNGSSFELRSKNTLYLLTVNKDLQLVSLYDDNILFDNKKPADTIPTFKASAIALNNALLNVSPVIGYGLFGELLNEDTFDKGILAQSHGLLSYLPTLPDPYAANIGIFRRQYDRGTEDRRYTTQSYYSLLVAMTGWATEPGLPEKTNPVLSFHFAPAPEQQPGLANNIRLHNIFSDTEPGESGITTLDFIQNKKIARRLGAQLKTFAEYNRAAVVSDQPAFIPPINDLFSLVDVSTNADWMGVSFGMTDDNFIFRRTHTVNPVVPAGNPLKIKGMDVVAPGKYVRAFTTPLISWEPVFNITPPPAVAPPPSPQPPDPPPPFVPDRNPPLGFLFFENDGGPTRIFNTSAELVSLAPIPVTDYILDNAKNHPELPAWSVFTLSFGIRSLGIFYKDSFFETPAANGKGAKLAMNAPEFPDVTGKLWKGGIQLKVTGAEHPMEGKIFEGGSYQLSNIVSITGTATNKSILGTHVTQIFNSEFGRGIAHRGVPVERIDFSGYGASIFSNWKNPNAAFAKTSQARFDVFKGRTAHEVIQVKSIIYPWGIKVVRTITILRAASAYIYRHDSGWVAESEGLYDFSNHVYALGKFDATITVPSPFTFHPGIVKGVYNVKNIIENDLVPFLDTMKINTGENYIDENTGEQKKAAGVVNLNVLLTPVYFDAEVLIDFVSEGKVNGKVPSKKMLGYVQLNPLGQPISAASFKNLLALQNGSLGGPVDCMVDIAGSKQKMRINRVDVNNSENASGNPVFASAVKGSVVLPKDGSWSIVQHTKVTDEVTPVTSNNSVPLVKEGILAFTAESIPIYPPYTGRFKIANPFDLVKNANDAAISYGFLQNTDTQKVLFKNPEFQDGIDTLLQNIQAKPKLADAYRLLNSPGIFPKLKDVLDMDLGAKNFEMKITEQGYKLLNKIDPLKKFEQEIPEGPWRIIDEEKLKIYIEYAAKDKDNNILKDGGGNPLKGILNYDVDSAKREWLNKMTDITMVIDLLSFTRIMLIRGKFDTAKGKAPSILKPELEFGKDLQPVVEILRLLAMLALEPDYKEILEKGLKIVMSNSPENWEYKFQADKEIPVVKFPPARLDGPTTPLRLEAGLKVGAYFNMAIPIPPVSGITTPSAGAYIEFYGKLSVMCLSVAAATIYAVGSVNLRLSADTKVKAAVDMKFTFAAELMVGLPVIANVSVTFGAGVEIHIDSNKIMIGALIFFRGRAEILGGIVTITIYIEASGKVERSGLIEDEGAKTNCIAQVTFALDISICFVINISFEEKWQETKQIA